MSKDTKDVQIPQELFSNMQKLVQYLLTRKLSGELEELCKTMDRQISAKLAAIERRKACTTHKVAETEEARKAGYNEYLHLKAAQHGDEGKDVNDEKV